jgi:hypothetical protein
MSTISPIHRAHAGLDATALDRLAHSRYAVLGTVNDDGSVHVAPLMYWYENGRIYLETAATLEPVRSPETIWRHRRGTRPGRRARR